MFSKINEENKKERKIYIYKKVGNYQASRKMTGNSVVGTGVHVTMVTARPRTLLEKCLKHNN